MTNFLNLTSTEFSAAIIVFNLILAFALSLVIAWVYKKTHKGLSYSQSFLFTVVIVGILGAVVMMVVQNNIVGAFALLGAFSLIRFRTILKETRDVAFVFFSLVIGVAIGTSNYAIAVISTIIISLIILILSRRNFGSVIKSGFLITFAANNAFPNEGYEEIFKKHLSSYNLLHIKALGKNLKEYSFAINFRNEKETDQFLKDLLAKPGVENADLISGKTAVEY